MRHFYCTSCDFEFDADAPCSCPRCGATEHWIEELTPEEAVAARWEGQQIAEAVADEDWGRR